MRPLPWWVDTGGMSDRDVFLARLHHRLRLAAGDPVPEDYYRRVGHPFLNTPRGLILRPSLVRHHQTTGL